MQAKRAEARKAKEQELMLQAIAAQRAAEEKRAAEELRAAEEKRIAEEARVAAEAEVVRAAAALQEAERSRVAAEEKAAEEKRRSAALLASLVPAPAIPRELSGVPVRILLRRASLMSC